MLKKKLMSWINVKYLCVLMYVGIFLECASKTQGCPQVCACLKSWQVDCTGKNLTRVPENIPIETQSLILNKNNISIIPDEAFKSLPNLKTLYLANNNIRNFSLNAFQGLTKLKMLELSGNKITEIRAAQFKFLPQLSDLKLETNRIRFLHPDCFLGLQHLKLLLLSDNEITNISKSVFEPLKYLQDFSLNKNRLTSIPSDVFSHLRNLDKLFMNDNKIKHIDEDAFRGLTYLSKLDLSRNFITNIPSAFADLHSVEYITIESNFIQRIPDNAFAMNKNLKHIRLDGNPLIFYGHSAFANLPFLNELLISEAQGVDTFPNMTGNKALSNLRLDRSNIKSIPSSICTDMPILHTLDVHSNKITNFPDISKCKALKSLNLGNNELRMVPNHTFANDSDIQDLTLSHNRIEIIYSNTFIGLKRLQYLDMSNNKIKTIEEGAFKTLKELEDLNLSENKFPRLPTEGLQRLTSLKTFHNRNLQEAIDPTTLPKIQTLVLSYAYHCCDFIHIGRKTGHKGKFTESVKWMSDTPNISSINTVNISLDAVTEYDIQPHTDIMKSGGLLDVPDVFVDQFIADVDVNIQPPITCEPMPGPFLPCEDLFGWWSLRCGVWVVFVLAVVGNGVVLFVSICGRTKIDVPRFLICNLACGDLFMGIYLGFLAFVDASTLGSFQEHAIRWQISPGCLIAGFLGVFSSELSVFTLSVITLERYYAISHALQLNKRLNLRLAGYIMGGGWLFCLLLASLPLFGISDYRKFAICLPFETTEQTSLVYVCFILLFNAASFVVIVGCYIKIYISILGSQASNTKDFHVAKRMAILVFTDFLCWAPIILFSITAAFGENLIGLNEAKILTIFVLPLNSCANPFLYTIFSKQFKRDCVKLCKRIEESSISRSLSSLNSRRISLGCGNSGWRQYQPEKRSSCSNSFSGGSNPANGMHRSSTDGNMYERTTPYLRKPSGESLLEDTPITCQGSDQLADPKVLQLTPDDCSSCTRCHETRISDGKRRLSVGVAGTESQIVIHFDRKGNITTSETVSVKAENTEDNKELQCNQNKMNAPEILVDEHKEMGVDKCRQFDGESPVKLKIKDLTAQEMYKYYRRNKEQSRKKAIKSDGDSIAGREKFLSSCLPDSLHLQDKNIHINEWRKSSNLSCTGRNPNNNNGGVPKYKSNSLVDLSRASESLTSSPIKRRSLSSRHEGYILLKSANRDSAYEDEDEMLEYQENKDYTAKQCRHSLALHHNASKEAKCLKRKCGPCELFEEERPSLLSFSNRGSSDKESGISSEYLASQ